MWLIGEKVNDILLYKEETEEAPMGFWVFMLLMNMLVPFTMIGFGKMFLNHISYGTGLTEEL